MNTILGIKQAQMQRFLEDGTRIPVTVVRVPENTVTAIKTLEKDGYQAVQLGMGSKKKATKAVLGHAKKANLQTAPKVLKEVRTTETLLQGEFVAIASVLKAGDIINVTGVSKGKGFAGGVKRYGFKGGPRTHGQSDRERAPGSIGQTTTPGRVYKGKRMAGRMGHETKTVMNLLVVDVNEKNKEVLIKGLVPGNMGSMITITKVNELPEKKVLALLADPFAPVVPEVVEEEASVVTENTNETTSEAVALQEEKQDDTMAANAQSAEEKIATEGVVEEVKEVEDTNGK